MKICFYMVLLAAALLVPAASATALSETLNKKSVPLVQIGTARYIALDVFQEALQLEGDQTLTGSYRLFGAPGLTRDVVVEFSSDSPQILVNDKEATLKAAPVMQDGKLHVPYEEFVALFVAEQAAEKPDDARPVAEGAVLKDLKHARQGSITTLSFKFEGRPDYRFLFDGDTATLQVVFKQASKTFTSEELEVESEEVSRVTLEPIPDKGVLVASVHLRTEVTYDSAFDEVTGVLTLRLKGPGTLEAPPASAHDVRGTDMQSFLSRHVIVLDAGHGGEDKGVAPEGVKHESKVVLELALRLKPLLEKGGFKVALTRNSEGGLSLNDRLVAINAARPGMVLSLHANSSPNPDVQGTQIFVIKPPPSVDPSDPYAPKKGVAGPSVEEINLGAEAARRISTALAKNLKRRVELIQEGLLMPASKVFGPAMTVEVAYLTSPKDRALLDKKAFVDKLSYSIYSGLYDHFLDVWKASGGKGPAVTKLSDVPAALPPAERAAPAPVATKPDAKKSAPPVVVPESANAADDESDEEPLDGPDEDPPPSRTRSLPKATAVPPPPPRPAAPVRRAVVEDEEPVEEDARAPQPSVRAPRKPEPEEEEEE
jgi:N-acetylmuramoyl-L-alanine amidase